MTDKFRNRYRIPSARLSHWDYGSNAMYFVTICTKHRECYFGDVVDDETDDNAVGGAMDGVETPESGVSTGPPPLAHPRRTDPSSQANPGHTNTTKMQLSEIGLLAQKYWLEIPIHFPFVVLDEFVVMPDHVHGIMVIDKTDTNAVGGTMDGALDGVETPNLGVSTDPPQTAKSRHADPPSPAKSRRTAHASQKWNPGTLGVIINQYKRMVTIRARKIHADFGWQSCFTITSSGTMHRCNKSGNISTIILQNGKGNNE